MIKVKVISAHFNILCKEKIMTGETTELYTIEELRKDPRVTKEMLEELEMEALKGNIAGFRTVGSEPEDFIQIYNSEVKVISDHE